MKDFNIAVVTVTYGNRWKFLSRVVEAVASSPLVSQIIIVDNASNDRQLISDSLHDLGERVYLIQHDENLGSAGGYAAGIDYARERGFDFILLLDDDNTPEEGAIEKYIEAYKRHGGGKIIIGGNRVDLKGSQEMFEWPPRKVEKSYTFFSVFSFSKVLQFLSFFFKKSPQDVHQQKDVVQSIEIFAFGYGGAFLPKQAIVEAPLPNVNLFTYGDDMEYSWGIHKLGYRFFLEKDITIRDVDLTFSQSDHTAHLTDLFSAETPDSKVFYRMRNAAYISKKHTLQTRLVLVISIVIWYCGLLVLVLFKKKRLDRSYFKRAKLIGRALYLGYIGRLEKFI